MEIHTVGRCDFGEWSWSRSYLDIPREYCPAPIHFAIHLLQVAASSQIFEDRDAVRVCEYANRTAASRSRIILLTAIRFLSEDCVNFFQPKA
jgi:hypothetical protein